MQQNFYNVFCGVHQGSIRGAYSFHVTRMLSLGSIWKIIKRISFYSDTSDRNVQLKNNVNLFLTLFSHFYTLYFHNFIRTLFWLLTLLSNFKDFIFTFLRLYSCIMTTFLHCFDVVTILIFWLYSHVITTLFSYCYNFILIVVGE